MEITTAMIKELREKTGAGILDCKTALAEANGSIEEAEKLLRKKGLAAAAKKAGRVAAEGLVGYALGGGAAVQAHPHVACRQHREVTVLVQELQAQDVAIPSHADGRVAGEEHHGIESLDEHRSSIGVAGRRSEIGRIRGRIPG